MEGVGLASAFAVETESKPSLCGADEAEVKELVEISNEEMLDDSWCAEELEDE